MKTLPALILAALVTAAPVLHAEDYYAKLRRQAQMQAALQVSREHSAAGNHDAAQASLNRYHALLAEQRAVEAAEQRARLEAIRAARLLELQRQTDAQESIAEQLRRLRWNR